MPPFCIAETIIRIFYETPHGSSRIKLFDVSRRARRSKVLKAECNTRLHTHCFDTPTTNNSSARNAMFVRSYCKRHATHANKTSRTHHAYPRRNPEPRCLTKKASQFCTRTLLSEKSHNRGIQDSFNDIILRLKTTLPAKQRVAAY